jgi:hypothetical protein
VIRSRGVPSAAAWSGDHSLFVIKCSVWHLPSRETPLAQEPEVALEARPAMVGPFVQAAYASARCLDDPRLRGLMRWYCGNRTIALPRATDQ